MKRLIGSLTLLCLSLLYISAASADDLKLSPYGKVFVGSQGLVVEIATVDAKNKDGLHDALIRITGSAAHDAGIDGQVIMHEAIPAGTGFDYVAKDIHRMSSRSSWGSWDFFEVHLGGKSYDVGYDDKKSKELKVADLQKAYSGKSDEKPAKKK
jgi:hypothetical protein